jgi:hypothetical protein
MLTTVISSTAATTTAVSTTAVSTTAATTAAVSSALTSSSSMVTSSAASSSAVASVISMTTPIGLPEFGVLAVIALIILLSAKEILSASHLWSRPVNCSLNMGIMTLLISFFAIVTFNVTAIV